MGRPQKIILPQFYPRTCEDCPLLGTRPKEELTEGDKWTKKCMADGRVISGRGSKQPKARNRCGVRKYEELYFRYSGKFLIHDSLIRKYQLTQTKLLFPPHYGKE